MGQAVIVGARGGCAVSVAAVAWAFEQKLPANEKIVLLALADCENGQTALCIPGQERLAEMSSMSVRTVQRMLARLEERGYIRRERRTSAISGYRTSDSYVLALRDNLSGKPEPTRQIEQANTTTVSSIKEPEVGTGSNTPPTPSVDLEFEQLWAAWPKKTERKKAASKWRNLSAKKRAEILPKILAHAEANRQHTPPQFIPGLAPFLNGERWDEPLAVSRERGAYKPEPHAPTRRVIPAGHVPVRDENGQIIGSRPA